MARVITIPIGPIFTSGPCRGIIHVIRKGDTLYLLGKRYHVPVSSIMYANPYVNIYNLQIGDELCIPVGPQPREWEEEEMPVPQTEPVPGERTPRAGMPQGEFGELPRQGRMEDMPGRGMTQPGQPGQMENMPGRGMSQPGQPGQMESMPGRGMTQPVQPGQMENMPGRGGMQQPGQMENMPGRGMSQPGQEMGRIAPEEEFPEQ